MKIYLKKLADKIKEGIKNKQTPQEILCKLILWQWDDFTEALKTQIKKDLSPENFLNAYFKMQEQDLLKLLLKLDSFKNAMGSNVMQECLNCK